MSKNEMVTCGVANENCSAPAAWGVGGSLMTGYYENEDRRKQAKFECFVCGEPVCGRCSRVVDYLTYGKQRVCDNCRGETK